MLTKKDIKKLIIDKDTTAAAIAEKFGLTRQNFNSFLQKNFTQADLIKIADALGVYYVSAFVDNEGRTLAGGVCSVSELTKKPDGNGAGE